MKYSIYFTYKNNTLNIATRANNEETHSFNIIKENKVTINNVVHTLLISDNNESFYIVNNQFHREDDKPAIICRRFDISYTDVNNQICWELNDNLKLFWCKMWLKNGLFHRENDKPALIWDNGDLMWMIKGNVKRNPFEHMSVYINKNNKALSYDHTNNGSQFIFHDKEETQRQQRKGLIAYDYDNCG